jgi:hypothetical protein
LKIQVTLVLFCLAIAGIPFLPGCAKSSSTSSGGAVNVANLAGTWANTGYIDATSSPAESLPITNYADTLQFDGTGKLYAGYYTKVFSPAVDSAVWVKSTDTASYTIINDSALYINGHTGYYFVHSSSDTFGISTLNAHQLNLFSPNPGGGGYYYVFSK